jgi:hypothetical protein
MTGHSTPDHEAREHEPAAALVPQQRRDAFSVYAEFYAMRLEDADT